MDAIEEASSVSVKNKTNDSDLESKSVDNMSEKSNEIHLQDPVCSGTEVKTATTDATVESRNAPANVSLAQETADAQEMTDDLVGRRNKESEISATDQTDKYEDDFTELNKTGKSIDIIQGQTSDEIECRREGNAHLPNLTSSIPLESPSGVTESTYKPSSPEISFAESGDVQQAIAEDNNSQDEKSTSDSLEGSHKTTSEPLALHKSGEVPKGPADDVNEGLATVTEMKEEGIDESEIEISESRNDDLGVDGSDDDVKSPVYDQSNIRTVLDNCSVPKTMDDGSTAQITSTEKIHISMDSSGNGNNLGDELSALSPVYENNSGNTISDLPMCKTIDNKDIYSAPVTEATEKPSGDLDVEISENKNLYVKSPVYESSSMTTMSSNLSVPKTVALDDAEEGELDYEEEEVTAPVDEEVDQEEGEIMDEKEVEGSEEGEIVSDGDDQQPPLKRDGKEDGEINEDHLEEGQLDEEAERGHRPRTLCKYYEAGSCRWGALCRFLHPGINDKGNYLMHRPPGMYPTAFGKPPPPNEIGPINPVLPRVNISVHAPGFVHNMPSPTERAAPISKKESAWERGLKKAKEVKLTSQKRREEDELFEEKRMNLSIKEVQKESDKRSPTTSRREQWRPGNFEREKQNEKFTPRVRPADYRAEVNERRFNRTRKSPPRYDQEREKGSRGHNFEKDKPRDMDRERFQRLQRRRSPTPPERRREKEPVRDREKEIVDKREKKPKPLDKKPSDQKPSDHKPSKEKETPKDTAVAAVKSDSVKVEPKKQEEPVKEDSAVPPIVKTLEAEQWRDPWMRTQPIVPEGRSPLRSSKDDDMDSADSSGSDSDSDSDDSEYSGSDSASDSKDSSDAEDNDEDNADGNKAKPNMATLENKDLAASKRPSSLPSDPRMRGHSSKDSTPKLDSPNLIKESSRKSDKGYPERPHRDSRGHERRRRSDDHHHRRGHHRSDERDRRHRDKKDGHHPSAGSFPKWLAPHEIDASWQRGGHPHTPGSYRGLPDRRSESRRAEDPRLKHGERSHGRRQSRSKSPHTSHHHKTSSVRDPRRGAKDQNLTGDKDRKPSSSLDRRGASPNNRRHSPKQKDPRSSDASDRKRTEDKNMKDDNRYDRAFPSKEKREMKPQPVKAGTKVSETKSTTAAQSDVSEDDFKSPKYDDSGSDVSSDSDSDSGSESGSDSEAGDSEMASASDSANSDSGGDSDSESDNSSGSSDEEALTSKKKELDQISKDVKMVSNLEKNAPSSSNASKSHNVAKGSVSSRSKGYADRNDPRLQIGQKRPLSAHNSANSSPKTGSNKTAARKDELLKELKAIEDAIARKRAKID